MVTAAIRYSGLEGANIDKEELLLNASRVRQYASELERAAVFILTAGYSEEDIRFAHPNAPADYGDISDDPKRQAFHPQGGGAEYKKPPPGVNDGSPWEFYGHTSLPETGSGRPELIAVLPNVTENFCRRINEMNGYQSAPPLDPGGSQDNCTHSGAVFRFRDAVLYSVTPNTVPIGSAPNAFLTPALEGCVECEAGGYHFFHVLHVR